MPRSYVLKDLGADTYFDQHQRSHHDLTAAKVFHSLAEISQQLQAAHERPMVAMEVTPMSLLDE